MSLVSQHKNLVVDLSNLTHIIRHSKFKKNGERYDKTMLFKYVIDSIAFYTRKFKVDGLLIACDGRNVWRKDIYPQYKGNRDADRDEYYEETVDVIGQLTDFFDTKTNAMTVKVDRAEADDVIAVMTRTNEAYDIIISSDRDFQQLVTESTVLFNPMANEFRQEDDPSFSLFLKVIRGDRNDGIPSAIPRIRETKVKELFNNQEEFVNVLESKNSRGELIKEQIFRNNTLINLNMIPEEIKVSITTKVFEAFRTNSYLNYNMPITRQFLAGMGFDEVMDDFDYDMMKLKYHVVKKKIDK